MITKEINIVPEDELKKNIDKIGLTELEVRERLAKYGYNTVKEKHQSRLLIFIKKFWAPVPWMLELSIIFEIILGKNDEAIIIFSLLLFNSLLSFFQEERANKAIILLRHHLAIKARVLRDRHWQLVAAQDLVPGDIVHLRMGDISPADIELLDGNILIDLSVLTGEAMPIEGEAGTLAYSGAVIKRGEATGKVAATGKHTYFGKSVELIQTARTNSHIKNIIFTIVKYLVIIDVCLASMVLLFAILAEYPVIDILPYILVLIVASIPVALPATFTLATALGAIQLAKKGVLVTHLTAIEEAATMDVVCLDKTGTITENKLSVAKCETFLPFTEPELLYYATLASDESSQDPIDQAILSAYQSQPLLTQKLERVSFIPFDTATKRTEAVFNQNNNKLRVIKGTPDTVTILFKDKTDISDDISQLAKMGYRILAVAVDKHHDDEIESHLDLVGLIAFNDPPRPNSKLFLHRLMENGLRTLIVTGDNKVTAEAIATNIGMRTRVISVQNLFSENIDALNYDIFAGMFPEDKFKLVKTLQTSSHIVGMTGDGVNDAPALKQAEVGIAVANATDVAKAAASIVLTQAGLSGILSTIEVSRRIYQRMLTYMVVFTELCQI